MDPEIERIRGYLVAQARKLTIPQLVEKLRRDSQAVREAVEGVPADRFAERPSPDDWSARDVLDHLIDTSERSAVLIGAVLDGLGVLTVPRDETAGEARAAMATGEDAWAAFTAVRERLYTRLLRASGDEHLDVEMAHPVFGGLNWREWTLFLRVHDLDHARQIQAIAERFGGPGVPAA